MVALASIVAQGAVAGGGAGLPVGEEGGVAGGRHRLDDLAVEQLRHRADADDGGRPQRLDRLDEGRDRRAVLRERPLERGEIRARGHQQAVDVEQRVALARALAPNPAILVADEPTGNLDEKTGTQIIDLLFQGHKERGTTLVLVTHDANLAARCERVVFIEDGQVQASPPQAPGKTAEETLHLAVAMVTASYKALIEPASDEIAKQEVEQR